MTVIDTLHKMEFGGTTTDVCNTFQELYPALCNRSILVGAKTFTKWERDVHNTLNHHEGKLFYAERFRGRLKTWSLKSLVSEAIADGTLRRLLRRGSGGTSSQNKAPRKAVNRRLNKIRAPS
ncbi:unnamed protein product [Polarella glacialis]|uniref:Uncharacterized protein n=1 Tax=Polarella glacialis TaxID=89957 RepID=A0A813DIP3_POLGL|nr:unnamed protein product [Polarella glacialis]CAE8723582.1 unnamed protein product [Polarella glacialis]